MKMEPTFTHDQVRDQDFLLKILEKNVHYMRNKSGIQQKRMRKQCEKIVAIVEHHLQADLMLVTDARWKVSIRCLLRKLEGSYARDTIDVFLSKIGDPVDVFLSKMGMEIL